VNYLSTLRDEWASGGHCLLQRERPPPIFTLRGRQTLPPTNIFNMQNLVVVMQNIFTFMVLRIGIFSKTTLLPFQRTMTKIQKIFQNVSAIGVAYIPPTLKSDEWVLRSIL